jgi:hypothetical protein
MQVMMLHALHMRLSPLAETPKGVFGGYRTKHSPWELHQYQMSDVHQLAMQVLKDTEVDSLMNTPHPMLFAVNKQSS